MMKRQKEALETALGKDIFSVRQHFLHYDIRVTPRVQAEAGFKQKEAYFFLKPCITTRDETEWVELVESGWNVVVGANQDSIIAAFLTLKCPAERQERLYGDGQAARKLAKYLMNEGWKGYCSCVY